MAKKKSIDNPTLLAEWTSEGPVVSIKNFEQLSPVKIEKCFEALEREWYRLRAVSIGERRKQEIEERTGAEDG